ncbi:MAG: CopD family protein [Gammaproteobacteria bacterium]|nr:CopD family protein [Gammaproteobacteria bacterium]MDE0713831.1 CopD family protein [Gammaproteobacteria bacterium]MXY66290.1 TIGR00701 family protein [Gammaproteobacteria bacterium]MYG66856.1 TIGR00701 family protein [Gammaproteobacteria bacterium]MYH91648.1 TIGR00701 family protein [Gammaproteobacteria bacterium]
MLWIKAFHIIFMVTWFAGMFYLPRLFVYHAMCTDEAGNARFKTMERKLFFGIMTPGGVLTIVFGLWLWLDYGFSGQWLMWKLLIVMLLLVYHGWCLVVMRSFQDDRNTRGHVYYRVMNELPVFGLIAIVLLAVLKPGV